jgi:cyclic beta-1,2-glucan synthetase
LSVVPLVPANWDSFEMRYCFGNTFFCVTVSQSTDDGLQCVVLDGVLQPGGEVLLVDDGREHIVEITVPRVVNAASLTPA